MQYIGKIKNVCYMRHFRAPALKCLKHLWPAKDGAELVFMYGHGVVKTDFSQRAPALVVECTRGTVLNTPLVLLMRIIFLIKRQREYFLTKRTCHVTVANLSNCAIVFPNDN